MKAPPDEPQEWVNWPTPGARELRYPANPCGHFECDDLPAEPGPCATFERCECGWPAAADEHCATCQHAARCHA